MSKDCLTCKHTSWRLTDHEGFRLGECRGGMSPESFVRVPPLATGLEQVAPYIGTTEGVIDDCPAWQPKEST